MRLAAITLFAFLALASGGALAQDAGAEQRARALFEDGVARTERGDLAGAVEVFRLSWAAYPRPRTMYNLALILDQLDRNEECLQAIDAFLAASDPVTDRDRRARVEAIRERRRTARTTAPLDLGGVDIDAERAAAPGDGRLARVVALFGIDRAENEDGASFGPLPRARAQIASGVVVTPKGLVVTTRSAIARTTAGRTEHADLVAVLANGGARYATVLAVHPSDDLALLELRASSSFAFAPLEGAELVERDAFVTSLAARTSGDRAERSDGRVSAVRADGTFEVSLDETPSTPGAAILGSNDALAGVASALLEGGPGRAGRVLVEPVVTLRALVEDARPAFAPETASNTAAARAVIELAAPDDAVPGTITDERVRSAEMLAGSPIPPSEAAAVCAASFRVIGRTLGASQAASPSALPPGLRERAARLERAARTLCDAARPAAGRHPFVLALSGAGGFVGTGATARPIFPETPPPAPPSPSILEIGVAGALVWDDPRGSVSGAADAHAHLTLGNWFDQSPALLSLLAGANLLVGSYRDQFVLRASVEIGFRFELGDRRAAAAAFLLYAPAWVVAEGRGELSGVSYRMGGGVRLGDVHLTVSFAETGRGANDTLRVIDLGVAYAL